MKIVVIAGPNGAGKTTFAREFLPHEAGTPLFVNADLIAEGLSPFRPEEAAIRAGRMMIEEIDRYAEARLNFAFETTLAGHTYRRRIPVWRAAGYEVKLVFLSLRRPEDAIARVAARVRLGGHHIPDDVVRRRFHIGMRNFELYRHEVDYWQLFDNSDRVPILLAEGRNS